MAADSQPKIARIAAPMVALLETLGVQQINTRTHKALCPLHSEKTASFSWKENGLWHCFGCGAGGDQISLVKAIRKCDFREAVKLVAAVAGVPLGDNREMLAALRAEKAKTEKEMCDMQRWLDRHIEPRRARAAEILRQLRVIRAGASETLRAILSGQREEKFPGELELCWYALGFVLQRQPIAAAAYQILSFAPPAMLSVWVREPDKRRELIWDCIEEGFFLDGNGKTVWTDYRM